MNIKRTLVKEYGWQKEKFPIKKRKNILIYKYLVSLLILM
jgi:hypothetical protein